jgi:hypothetical protein
MFKKYVHNTCLPTSLISFILTWYDTMSIGVRILGYTTVKTSKLANTCHTHTYVYTSVCNLDYAWECDRPQSLMHWRVLCVCVYVCVCMYVRMYGQQLEFKTQQHRRVGLNPSMPIIFILYGFQHTLKWDICLPRMSYLHWKMWTADLQIIYKKR